MWEFSCAVVSLERDSLRVSCHGDYISVYIIALMLLLYNTLSFAPYAYTSHGPLVSVRYGAGRGGFSLARPRPYTGPGGYVSGNPRPAPVRGPPALISWTGPRLLPPIFNGDPSGLWVGRGPERGQGQGMPKKPHRSRPLSGAGRGKWPGARVFRGPVRPVTNSTPGAIGVGITLVFLLLLHSCYKGFQV